MPEILTTCQVERAGPEDPSAVGIGPVLALALALARVLALVWPGPMMLVTAVVADPAAAPTAPGNPWPAAATALAAPETAVPAAREMDGVAARLARHIGELAATDSRVTGYPGAMAAADYLVAELESLPGVTGVSRHLFQVPVPVDEGAGMELDGSRLLLRCVWPNLVRTPTLAEEGITGRLLYGGRAERFELDGSSLLDAIVVLEYDCGMNWVTAFDLGAAAVIFLSPEGVSGSPFAGAEGALARTHRQEGAQKFLATPADLPRFFAPRATSDFIRRRLSNDAGLSNDPGRRLEPTVRLWGRMTWRRAQAQTVVAVFQGTDPQLAGQAMMIGAYYDAISPVPAMAPGADQASGVAAWLELAQMLNTHPPRQTVVLVATSGHFQALAGMRELVGEVMRPVSDDVDPGSSEPPARAADLADLHLDELEIGFFLGLDLSSHSRRIALVHAGTPYRVRKIRLPLFDAIEAFAASYEADKPGGHLILGGDLRPLRQRRLVGRLPERIPTQGAVVSLAGMPGLTLVTAGDERRAFDSPFDRPDEVDVSSLAEQVHFISALVEHLTQKTIPRQVEPAKDSFGRLRGRVVAWGERSYEPDRPVAGALVRVRSLHKSLMGVRADPMAFTDSSGAFELTGLEARTLYLKPVQLEAYSLDAVSGRVTQALDRGPYGAGQRPSEVLMDQLREERTLVVFPCHSLTLFDLFDPRNLGTLTHLRLLDAAREAEPVRYGYCMPVTAEEIARHGYYSSSGSATEQVAVAFAARGAALKLTMASDRLGLGRRLVLLNGGINQPTGRGYRPSTTPRLAGTARRVAGDMWRLDEFRLASLERHGIESAPLRRLHDQAGTEIQRSDAHGRAGEHTDFLDRSRRAWALSAQSYRAVEAVGTDAVRGVLFFLFLVLPFSVLGERLLLAGATVRLQVSGALAIFLMAFLVLRFSHPAFELTIYPTIVLVGFLSLALSMAVIWIGLSRLNAQLHESVSRRVAIHRLDTRRSAIFTRSLLLGVAQMRRRPWRTGLTVTTLAVLMFSLVSFTSVRSAVRYNRTPLGPVPEAAGIMSPGEKASSSQAVHALLIRRPEWEGLEAKALDFLSTRFSRQLVLDRYWYLSPALLSGRDGRTQRLAAALGLSASEPELTGVGDALLAGRWFNAAESDVCILPEGVARTLGISLSAVGEGQARVSYLGGEYRVVGVFDADRFEAIKDLHGGPLTPLDLEIEQTRERRVGLDRHGVDPIFTHLSAGQIILLPSLVVSRWGEHARLASIAVVFSGAVGPAEAAIHDFASALDINLTALMGGRRYLINTVGVRTLGGRAGVLVPLVIAALIVFNTMLGTVHERRGEIGILNAVGLAPVHVTGLFMAEAGTYAVLSAVLGFLAAQVLARLGWVHGLFPGLTVNFSSYSAVVTIGVVMAVVLLSALYPAYLAGRICLPGIERAWQLPEPRGDRLFLPMPFALQATEARQLVCFMTEYLEGYDEQSIGAGFYAEGIVVSREGASEATVWLAPFDQGVSQRLRLDLSPAGDDRFFSIRILIERKSGERSAWLRANRGFVDRLRKQFLVWRGLSDAERQTYT
jgi:hypothetical protein